MKVHIRKGFFLTLFLVFFFSTTMSIVTTEYLGHTNYKIFQLVNTRKHNGRNATSFSTKR